MQSGIGRSRRRSGRPNCSRLRWSLGGRLPRRIGSPMRWHRLRRSSLHPTRRSSITAASNSQTGSQSVHERVCFMCSILVGMITQSWWPPVLGRMPIRVSVSASITEMPLDSRWKPLNGVSTYLPS